jgi:hypothetical protein
LIENGHLSKPVEYDYHYEGWDCTIYKEQNGKWEKVYHGGGGGC